MAAKKRSGGGGDDSIENRVWLFEALGKTLIAARAEDFVSKDPAVKRRAHLALAELAEVACEVADSGGLSPAELRARLEK